MENFMKIFFIAIAVVLLASSAFADSHQHKESAAHDKNSHSSSSLVLNHGKKWPVDQVMKENMSAIHQKFKIIGEQSKSKKISNKDAHDLSAIISKSAKNIVSKCKMEAKQDEAFHVILGELFIIAADLEKTEKAQSALKKLGPILKKYSEYFDHPLAD